MYILTVQAVHEKGYCRMGRDVVHFHPMKLKKPEPAAEEAPQSTGGAAIAARFQLDADPLAAKKGPAGVGKTSTLIALVAALAALGLIGFAAWLMYSDWAVATVS